MNELHLNATILPVGYRGNRKVDEYDEKSASSCSQGFTALQVHNALNGKRAEAN